MTEQKESPLLVWWAQRSPRQRLIVAATALVAVVMGGDRFLTGPMERQVATTQAQLKTLQTRWADQSATAARAAAANPPEQELRQQEAELRARLETAQKRLEALNRHVADQSRLPETVRTLIATVGSARLVALDLRGEVEEGQSGSGGSDSAAAPAKLAPPNPSSPSNPPNPSSPTATVEVAGQAAQGGKTPKGEPATHTAGTRKLYKLPITVKVSGSYQELQTVLSLFERHAESLQWTTLSLDGGDWPSIQMTLRAYVLSFEPRWGASP